MAARLPFRRTHTGDRLRDEEQRSVQRAAAALNRLTNRVDDLDEVLPTLVWCHGIGLDRVVMGDADKTMDAESLAFAQISLTGTHTAARTLTVPRATDDGAYFRWISNQTAGGFAIAVSNVDGSVSVAAGASRFVVVSSEGPEFLV